MKKILAVVFTVALIAEVSADYWGDTITTNSSSWSIKRQSGNISFSLSGSVEGKISPVDFHGRTLSPYQSYYAEVGANDVRLRERTEGLEGSYKSEDEMTMQSLIENAIYISIVKPNGSKVYTISHIENWPVVLTASRTVEYSGQRINDRDFEGNNLDFVGSNALYNQKLSKQWKTVMWLNNMNATVLATDNNILVAKFMPTKYLGYMTKMYTTGIADLKYRQTGSDAHPPRTTDYITIGEGEERYYGAYDLTRKIEMRSEYKQYNATDDDWLPPCCFGGWDDMIHYDRKGFGKSAKDIFDCRCYKVPSEAQLIG